MNDPDAIDVVYSDWGVRVLADFEARMPKGIDYTSVLQLDEGHVHIHILAMNTPDPKLDANKLHAGKVAMPTAWSNCFAAWPGR